MESTVSPILRGLNPAQRDAVVNFDVPSLIIAGAGSGKTRVLTSRIAYMIEQGVDPSRILALTFTNKAAEQMRERIAGMIPAGRSRYIRMGTFHSVFSRILRENAGRIGYPESFTIYDTSDSRNLLKTLIKELQLPDEKYKPNAIASRISYAKNCLVTPGAYLANAAYAAEDRQAQIPEFGNLYNAYCQRCKHNGAMDFDDLLLQTNILLRDCGDVLAHYQEQFRYILVDEYQDTNYAQYVIIRRLSQQHGKVCVVGDDAQSIYSFRGAKIENILSFRKDYPSAMTFKLEQNYRSTRTIVEAANSVIVRNAKRMEKNCFSAGEQGDRIRILKAYTDREEAELVVSAIRDRIRTTGDPWSDAAILYRTNQPSRRTCAAAASPTAFTRARRSTTIRRSATCWPTSGWWSIRATTRPSAASSTTRRAASATRPCSASGSWLPSGASRCGRRSMRWWPSRRPTPCSGPSPARRPSSWR